MAAPHPYELPMSPRVIVLGDLHGDVGMLCACLYMADIINTNFEWIAKPHNTYVVQMGDQLDSLTRAPDSDDDWERLPDTMLVEFMERLDGLAKPHGGRVVSLIGNHDLMNIVGDMSYVSQASMARTGPSPSMRHRRFAPGMPLNTILASRPIVLKIGRVLFVHGGLLPMHLVLPPDIMPTATFLQTINQDWTRIVQEAPWSMDNMASFPPFLNFLLNPMSPLWNRAYVENPADVMGPALDEVLSLTDCTRMVVGHTTVPNITALFEGKLLLVDVGLSRAMGQTNDLQVIEITNAETATPTVRKMSTPKK